MNANLVFLLLSAWVIASATAETHGRDLQVEKDKRPPPVPNSAAAGGSTDKSVLSQSMELLSKGKYELFNKDIETVWQLPPGGAAKAKGVLFVAHGCHHGAVDWWPQSAGCPNCTGLPEEMNVTVHSLLRGYAVVAVSSKDRARSKCWESLWGSRDELLSRADNQTDWERVKAALTGLMTRESLTSLPLFGLGASSGGGFVLGLPPLLPGLFSGIVSQIMAGAPKHFAAYERLKEGDIVTSHWPPTAFVHMPRDATIAHLVSINVAELKELKIRHVEFTVNPQPLTPLYMAQRCAPEVDAAASEAIYAAFKSHQGLDSEGYLLHNPRLPPDWRMNLQKSNVPGVTTGKLRLLPEASPIAEELNLLYGAHELTSETTTDLINWLEASLAATPADERAVGIRGESPETV